MKKALAIILVLVALGLSVLGLVFLLPVILEVSLWLLVASAILFIIAIAGFRFLAKRSSRAKARQHGA